MNRNFYLIWAGQFVSAIGSQGYAVAEMFWTKHATGSATLMGFLMIASMVPALILGPIGGVIADRYSRKKIIVLCDFINAAAVCSLSLILFLIPDKTLIIIIALFVVTLTLAVSGAFFRPAIISAIPDIVSKKKVDRANSLNESSGQIALFIGQGLGGVLYRILGAPVLFLVDGATYLVSGISGALVDIPLLIPEKKVTWKELYGQVKTDLKEGVHYVWNNDGLKTIIIVFSALNFFLTPVILLFPFYIEDYLKVGTQWYGYMLSAFGVGTIVGYFIVGILKPEGENRSNIVVFSLFNISILLSSVGFIKAVYLSFLAVFAAGIMVGVINLNLLSILQISIPANIRGRVFGLMGTVAGSLAPLGMGLSGIAADLTNKNIPLIYSVCGGGVLIMSVIVLLNFEFRNYIAKENRT